MKKISFVSLLALMLVSCGGEETLSNNEIEEKLKKSFEETRKEWAKLSFEEFESKVYREPFDDGVYIVNGDTPIRNIKLLREFYDTKVKIFRVENSEQVPEFIINKVGALDDVWSVNIKKSLTYCVSNKFESRHAEVVKEMRLASIEWEKYADIDFIYVADQDNSCDENNNRVQFDIRPVNVKSEYLARAFFPNDPRKSRNILIDDSSFALKVGGKLTLGGILRHELGHTLGARHEHTRPESGDCFEDLSFNEVTTYDPKSVMHYPQCNGKGDWSLVLTSRDKNGVACTYGATASFNINTEICKPRNLNFYAYNDEANFTKVLKSGENIEFNEEIRFQDFKVKPGTHFTAILSSIDGDHGDGDLYVSFDKSPLLGVQYDCRPFDTSSNERCDVIVPADASVARVMVHGYSKAKFDLVVRYIETNGET